MSEKKNAAITIHLPDDLKNQFSKLADRDGISLSEWFLGLGIERVKDIKEEFDFIKSVFNFD